MNTPLNKLIAEKWFLPLDKLAERTGIGVHTLGKIICGKNVGQSCERKLRVFLESYKGETN